MKMFNHLKHLTLNKVYLKYFGIPQESFEVAQNPRQTRDRIVRETSLEKKIP